MTAPRRRFYLMYEGWMDHPSLGGARQPYCKRAAWAWLIEHAAWSDTKTDVGGKLISVKKGQYSTSYRQLAKHWKWGLAVVQRFIERLKTDTLIEASTDTGRLLITVCNYGRYQDRSRHSDTPLDTAAGTEAVRGEYGSSTQKHQGTNIPKEDKITVPTEPSRLPVEKPTASASPQPSLLPTATITPLRPPSESDQALVLWNEVAAKCDLSKATMTEPRRKALPARLRQCGGIKGWNAALMQVSSTPFLLGENERGWKATFDFMLKPQSLARVMEGTYGNRGKGRKAQPEAKLTYALEYMNRAQASFDDEPPYDVGARAM